MNENYIHLSENYHPDIFNSYKKFKKDSVVHFKNMFIMKKELFFEYCETLFDIIFKVQKQFGNPNIENSESNTKKLTMRIFGYLSEFITSFFIEAKKMQGFKVLESPIIKTDYSFFGVPAIYRVRTSRGGKLYLFGKKIFTYSYYNKRRK